MKVVSQIVLAIVAIVGLVAGVTYVSQFYSSRAHRGTTADNVPAPTATLTFAEKIRMWDPPTLGQFEVHAPGHEDFPFINKNSVPVDLGLMSKSCKCSDIKACVLTEEEARRFGKHSLSEAAALVGASRQGVLGFLCEAIKGRDASPDLQEIKLNWQV